MADSISELVVFSRVVDSGGFSAAARTLGMSTAMVSRTVAALEARLGARLLDRNTRRTSPTPAGARFHERVTELLEGLADAEGELRRDASQARGLVRISMPVEFASHHFGALLPRLLARHPELTVSISVTNQVVDLVEEGIDLAIRFVRDYDSGLSARVLGRTQLWLVAAPSLLERVASVSDAADTGAVDALALCDGLVYGDPKPWNRFPYRVGTRSGLLVLRPRLVTSSVDLIRTAALEGSGIGILPTLVAGSDVRAGRLRRLLPDHDFGFMKVLAVYASRRHLPLKVRAVIEFLDGCFGGDGTIDPFVDGLHRPT